MNFQTFNGFNIASPTHIKICAVGSYLPEEVLKSDDIFNEFDSAEQYNIATDWMSNEMGIEERRVAPTNTKPSQLAIPAAQAAIDNLDGLSADLIDMVIFCGIERDQSEPATAHTIQQALGLHADHAFDVSNACFGFMHGIEIATNYIRSGSVRLAMVVTGEVPSRVLRAAVERLKAGLSRQEAQDIIGALSVGDAGGAVILGPSAPGELEGFRIFNTKSDSSHAQKCYYRVESDGSFNGQMKMGPIVGASIWMHRKIIGDTLDMLGWDKFDWLCMHQTGRRPFEKFGELSTVKKRNIVKTYNKLGNITSATFPVNFEKLINSGKVKPRDRIGGIHSGSGLVVGEFGYQM